MIRSPALLLTAWLLGVATASADEFHHDFRGRPVPAELTLFPIESPFSKEEAEGLRITLPRDRKYLAPVGVRTNLPVQGNFEITATVQILEAETPTQGFGVGVTVYVQKAPPRDEGATLCRFVRAQGKQILFWDRSIVRPDEETKFDGGSSPCTATEFRLRLKRTGTTLRYQWAPGTTGDDAFQEIHKLDFGADDLKLVELRCTTGGQPCKLDARILDLRIRSKEAADADSAPEPVAAPPSKYRRLWWLVGGSAGIVGLWLVLLLSRRYKRSVPVSARAKAS